MDIPIESIIQEHTEGIFAGKFSPPQKLCPKCFQQPETFKLHECKKRSFRYVIENIVKTTITLLLRWKCQLCRSTFIEYPEFALPHKRYVQPDIERFCKKYIMDETQTYQKVVTHKNGTIGYHEEGDKHIDQFLFPSTSWRWIEWLGRIKYFAKETFSLFLKNTGLQIPQKKYRTKNRKTVIQRAYWILFSHALHQTKT
ncbi:DUF6431 domain-containing protein [Desulfobacterales bacterium HSG17]|nr:DUF6431 domain-containing protein [Desulfobacterales bacterium HSG17]